MKKIRLVKDTKSFIEVVIKKFGGEKFIFDKVDYVNSKTPVKIGCIKCLKYTDRQPDSFLRSPNPTCTFCVKRKGKTTAEFIEESNLTYLNGGDIWDYSLVDYKTARIPVKIICKKCLIIFERAPDQHLGGHGCSNCLKRSQEEFISSAHEKHGYDLYCYSETIYLNAKTNVKIYCNLCQEFFYQRPGRHLEGHGCPNHIKTVSQEEKEVWKFLEIPAENKHQRFSINGRKFIPDVMFSDHKIIIEYLGDKYHGHPDYTDKNQISFFNKKKTFGDIYLDTFERKKFLEEHGWTVIFIWSHEWKKVRKLLDLIKI